MRCRLASFVLILVFVLHSTTSATTSLDNYTIDPKITKRTKVTECDFKSQPIKSLRQLDHCKHVVGDLIIDAQTEGHPHPFLWLSSVQGCVYIRNTKRWNFQFVHETNVSANCENEFDNVGHERTPLFMNETAEYKKHCYGGFIYGPEGIGGESIVIECTHIIGGLLVVGIEDYQIKPLPHLKRISRGGVLYAHNYKTVRATFLDDVNTVKTAGSNANDEEYALHVFGNPKLEQMPMSDIEKLLSVNTETAVLEYRNPKMDGFPEQAVKAANDTKEKLDIEKKSRIINRVKSRRNRTVYFYNVNDKYQPKENPWEIVCYVAFAFIPVHLIIIGLLYKFCWVEPNEVDELLPRRAPVSSVSVSKSRNPSQSSVSQQRSVGAGAAPRSKQDTKTDTKESGNSKASVIRSLPKKSQRTLPEIDEASIDADIAKENKLLRMIKPKKKKNKKDRKRQSTSKRESALKTRPTQRGSEENARRSKSSKVNLKRKTSKKSLKEMTPLRTPRTGKSRSRSTKQ